MFFRAVLALALAGSAAAGPATALASFPGTTINAAQVDVSGNIYLAGFTGTLGTPSTYHAFVAKLNPAGSTIYSVNLRGSGSEYAAAIAVDATGSAYVFGQTTSRDFPVTPGALQTSVPPGMSLGTSAGPAVGFVVKLDAQGKVVYSTFLGDNSLVNPGALLPDSSGNLFLSGVSLGAFPATTTAPSTSSSPSSEFVVKLNSAGSAITGAIRGVGGLLAADGQGNVYVGGVDKEQGGIPITPGAYQSKYPAAVSCGGDSQVGIPCPYQYVTKLDPGLTQIVYSTYADGSYGASPAGIGVDAQGDVYLVGTTNSPDYPTTPNALEPVYLANAPPPPQTCVGFCIFPPPATGYVTELNPTGTGLVYSTYFSGSQTDSIGFAAFTSNGIYVAGQAGSADLPGLDGFAQPCLPAPFETVLATNATSVGATHILSGAPAGGVLAVDPTTATLIVWAGSTLERFDPSAPLTPISCILDAADFGPVTSIAPGELLTIFGPHLADGVETPVPGTTSALTSVSLNGIPAPLLYVSPQQINLQTPYEVAGSSQVNVELGPSVGGSDSRTLGVAASDPAVFLDAVTQLTTLPSTCQLSLGYPAPLIPMAFNEDGSRNTCANPAKAGSTITLYAAGLGETSPAPVTGGITEGPPVALNLPVTVSGATFVSAISTVGWISGVWQLNLATSASFHGPTAISISVGSVPVRDSPLVLWVK